MCLPLSNLLHSLSRHSTDKTQFSLVRIIFHMSVWDKYLKQQCCNIFMKKCACSAAAEEETVFCSLIETNYWQLAYPVKILLLIFPTTERLKKHAISETFVLPYISCYSHNRTCSTGHILISTYCYRLLLEQQCSEGVHMYFAFREVGLVNMSVLFPVCRISEF